MASRNCASVRPRMACAARSAERGEPPMKRKASMMRLGAGGALSERSSPCQKGDCSGSAIAHHEKRKPPSKCSAASSWFVNGNRQRLLVPALAGDLLHVILDHLAVAGRHVG